MVGFFGRGNKLKNENYEKTNYNLPVNGGNIYSKCARKKTESI